MNLEARGGIEPRAFPPGALRFGLEDRCRERGPREVGGDDEIRTHNLPLTKRPLFRLELHRRPKIWPGREADAPLRTPRSGSHRSAGMSHAPITLVPKEGLKPSTSGL